MNLRAKMGEISRTAPVVEMNGAGGMEPPLAVVEGGLGAFCAEGATGIGAETSADTVIHGELLERCARLDTVVFCSQGLLTRGRPRVVHAVPMNGETESRLVRLAEAVEAESDHPLARAVGVYAERVGNFRSRSTGFKAHGGKGVEAVVDGRTVRVGKALWLKSLGVCFYHEEEVLGALESDGNTTLVVESDGNILGFLAVADGVTAEAESEVASLHHMGLTVLLMTGGPAASARGLALRLGIDEVMADLLPGEKCRAVAALRAKGKRLAMVGDGINDASALAASDLSIAIGTDLVMETADIVLVSDGLAGVSEAIRIGRTTVRTIRRNLFWAFFFNIALIPVAAGVGCGVAALPLMLREPHPIAAAGAMGLSLLLVAFTSLRLHKR